jgi:uncharacterized protein YbjQ (UPF0145 family)
MTDLPASALTRLGDTEHGGAWTSDLSVSEMAALRRAGFEPAGLVMGTSIYQVAAPWRYRAALGGATGYARYATAGATGLVRTYPCPHPWTCSGASTGYTWEQTAYETGMREAKDLAMGRLVAEAAALGAHGVVGVRLTLRHPDRRRRSVEFVAIGTAIRRPGGPALAVPFTSHLSAQEFLILIDSGHVPCSLVMGVGTVLVSPNCAARTRMTGWWNVELDQYSDAAHECHRIANAGVTAEASAARADGVIGVTVTFDIEPVSTLRLFDLRVIGTAVRRYAEAEPSVRPTALVPLAVR